MSLFTRGSLATATPVAPALPINILRAFISEEELVVSAVLKVVSLA
jgi:hypothetical protein